MRRAVVILMGATAAGVAGAYPVVDDSPTRVQTTLKVDMTPVGTLRPKAVGEVSASRWTVDCAGMDREHCDWRAIREYVAPLGVLKVKTAYYAVQNAVSVFNDDLECLDRKTASTISGLETGVIYDWRDRRTGLPVTVFWNAADIPSDSNETKPVEIRIQGAPLANPVWVDVLTGDAYAIPSDRVRPDGSATVYSVPAYDSPTFVADRSVLTLDESWEVIWTREHPEK